MSDHIEALETNLTNLSASQQEFAKSMLNQYRSRGYLSEKQWQWVEKLAVTKPVTKPAPIAVGDLSGLLRLFERARKHLKFPAIVIGSPAGDLRINMASDKAKQPGTLNVTDCGSFEDRVWYGRIQRDGSFEPSGKVLPLPPGLTETLVALAVDPAAAAAKHGRLTGRCCFCNQGLNDPRSTAVGYGPICADHFELPWGEVKTDLKAMSAPPPAPPAYSDRGNC